MRDEFLDPGVGRHDAEESVEAGLRPTRARRVRRPARAEGTPHRSCSRRPASGASRSTTCCSPVRPGSARPRWPASSPPRWASHLHVTSGPALERAGDLAAILTKLEEGDVLFIDEIHRLSRAVEEILYPAMEDFQLDIVVGKGPAASSIRLTMPPFTLVGATTRTGMITGPLRDRFGLVARLDYYEDDELQAIVVRAAGILDVVDRHRRGVGDRPPVTRHAAHRQPSAAPCPRLRRGARTTVRSPPTSPATAWRCSASTISVSTRSTVRSCTRLCEQFNGGPVGLSTRGDQRRRTARHGRGRLRAVPDPAGHDRSDAARPRRDAGRVPHTSGCRHRRRRRPRRPASSIDPTQSRAQARWVPSAHTFSDGSVHDERARDRPGW